MYILLLTIVKNYLLIASYYIHDTSMQSLKNASSKNILPHSVIYVNIRSTNVQQVSMVVVKAVTN